MSVSSFPSASGLPGTRADTRWLRLLLGLALVLLGAFLILNPGVAASTLALVAGLTLVVHGVHELVASDAHRRTTAAAGALWVVAGVAALVWPDATLWVIAVVAGMSCVAAGSLKITTGLLARGEPHWIWTVVAGVVSATVGILALTWPHATVGVLGLLLGIRAAIVGVAEMVEAAGGRSTTALA